MRRRAILQKRGLCRADSLHGSEECTEDESVPTAFAKRCHPASVTVNAPKTQSAKTGCAAPVQVGGEDDCEANEDCIGGRCVPAICRGSVDCEDGLACRDGICVEEESKRSKRSLLRLIHGF